MATVLSVKERLKRQVGALDLIRQKSATVNDLPAPPRCRRPGSWAPGR